jgi:hypothetical protein
MRTTPTAIHVAVMATVLALAGTVAHAGTQSPSRYTTGGYGAYYSPSGRYVSIETGGNTSSPHRADWYAYQQALNSRPLPQTPCGNYLRKPLRCKSSTLSWSDYQAAGN